MMIIDLLKEAGWILLWLAIGFSIGERSARKDKKDD